MRTAIHPLILVGVSAALVVGCGGGRQVTEHSTNSPETTSTATTGRDEGATPPAERIETTADESGKWTLQVPASWREVGDFRVPDAMAWYIDQDDSIRDNVAVVTSPQLPADMDFDQFMKLAIAESEATIENFKLESQEPITLSSGIPGARLRSTGTVNGRDVAFLQIVAFKKQSHAVVVTLATQSERIDQAIEVAEPHMRTIQPIADTG